MGQDYILREKKGIEDYPEVSFRFSSSPVPVSIFSLQKYAELTYMPGKMGPDASRRYRHSRLSRLGQDSCRCLIWRDSGHG